MSKAYAESRVRKAQEQRRKEEEQKKKQKQQAQVSKSSAKSAVGGALRGATASKSTGKAYKPAVESPSYDWLSGTTRTPSQFGQKAYDDNKATPYQQYMQNADAISSADALNRYMQQANDYFNNTYTDRNAGMKLRNSGLMSGVQNANTAGQKVQQYFSSNPQIYSNGQYAKEKANYDRVSSEVADPTLNYKMRARTGDASVFNENMDDTTRSQARRYFRQSQFENFTNAMKRGIANGGHVGGSAQKQYSDREIAEIMAGKVPDFKATQAVTGGADTYQGVADMQSAYSRDQVAADVETVTYQDGTAREIQAAAERLDALVGSGYSARLQQNWSKDPNVRMEALNAYDANEQMLSNYYDQTVGTNSPDEVKTSYDDYKNYLVGYNKQLAKEAKDEKLRQQLEADFGDRVQSANAKKSSGGTVAAAFAGLRGQEATKKQQGVYTMIAEGYDAARKAGYIDEWQDAQGHDPVTREYYDSGYDHMTDEEKNNFIALYNDPTQGPEVAFEYLNRLKYFTQQRDAYEMEKWTSDLAQKGFWGATAATGVGIAAGYANNAASLYVMTDRLINGDQDGKYNEYSPELRYSLIHDVALGTVGQVIEDATPNLELAGINIPKAFYNAATSAAESFLNTVSFGEFGAVSMGVGAAGSSYRSNLEKVGSVDGYTEKDAFVDGAFDGFVETLTEYVSVENLLNPTLNPKKNVLRAMWTEPSEEVLGWLLDNGYDTIKYGSRGEIAQRYDELLVQGYSDAEARATITQEMAQELTETILVAGLSGGMMGGPQAIAAQVENSRVGSKVQQNNNVTGLLDLADTLELPDDVRRMSAEQRSASEKGEKVSNAKLGRILRESMAKLDESSQQILSESAEKLAKNVLLENGYDGDSVNLNTLAEKVVKLVTGQNLTELEMKDVARSDAATKAVQALTERTAELKKINEKARKLDSFLKPREAAQTEISERLKEASAPQEVTEAFDESVAKADEAVAKATEAAESDTLSAEEERTVRLESFAAEYGKNADVMQNAINDGQDVDAYAKAFKVAEVRGEDGQSFDVVKKLSVLSDLTENQVRIAYELGRGIRGARNAQLRQNTNYGGKQVQVGNVDTSAIKGHLTGAQQRSVDAARSVAQALGVNIRFFESAANEIGQYTTENGSFDGDTMTISLDIHAGSNSKFNTDYAVMQTLGHELTHFVKSFADSEIFDAYQDFVIGHLSEKMDVDAEVERVTALSSERGVNLSRDGAIEEIIANASGEALMNITQEQITQLAQANPSLAKRIGNRIQEWVKKVLDRIRTAYKGGSVKYEVARQMQDVLTEMSEKWNNALVNAAQNRFGTKGQQQETAQQAETAVENTVENSETAHADEPVGKTEALAEAAQPAQEETESIPQPIAGRHIDQRTTDSVKGVDMDLFSSESERIQIGFAEAAKILLADLNNTIRGDKTFVSDGGADQTVLGQKRMTSALLEEIKDQTGWTWERIGKSLRAFVLAGETGDLVKNTVTNRTMELYLNEMLTEGYTTLEGVKLTPWGEYVDFVQGLEGAKEHTVREAEDAIPFEDYASADVEEAGAGGREGYGDSEPKYSLRVQDQDTLDFLNDQETVTTYKTMQLVNGKLFPPMAAVVAGQYEDASVLGQWEAAVEHPELVKVDKSGKTKFTLNKGKGKGSLDAAYNPYMHSSNLVLNDQFSSAYARPNLVTVECEVPVSELTSGYRAQYAKDTVGWHSWHTGTVAGALRKANGTERKVLLSRWIKPVRILENSEVARMYSELLDGTGIAVPDNVVPPDLLVELKKAGVPIAESGKVKAEANGDGVKYSVRDNSDEVRSIKAQIQAHSDELNEMDPVARVNVTLPARSDAATLRKWAVEMLKHTGFKVDRKGFGTIEFSENRIKNSLNYLNGRGEIAALATLHKVLKKGIEIGAHSDHKQRGYGSVTFAAPVEINGVRGNMAATVIQTNANHYKTHRIVMPDGSVFAYNNKNEATVGTRVYNTDNGAVPTIIQVASETSIAQPGENVKFSLREPVERTNDLIAVHNLTERNLLDAMNLGGLPSPSIAIVKARDGHSKYGPISIVFDRSSIDPQVDAKNHVYGGDAYTPTAPGVEYPVNYDRMLSIEKRLNQLATQVAGGIFQNSSVIRSAGIEDTSSRSAEQLAEQLANRDTVRAAYLAAQGESLDPVMQDKEFSRFGNDTLKAFVEQVGEQELAELNAAIKLGEKGDNYAAAENQVRQLIRAWYADKHKGFLDRKPELREKRIDNYMDNNVTTFTIEDFIKNAWEFYQDGGRIKGEINRMATSDALMERTDEREVTQWLLQQFDGILGAPGIYNGKERYTSGGNRRSFAQLHYAYTLENIVRAMTENQRQRGEGTWGISATALLSTATPEYGSIDEVRADSNRLQLASDEEYGKLLKELDGDIDSVIRQVRRQNNPHSDNSFEEGEIIGSVLMEAATGKQTPAAIIKAFSREGYAIDKDTAKLIQALYHTAAQFPTGYFEAKPERAVRFDEVKYAVVPASMNENVRSRLEKLVPDVRTYADGDETQRLELLNARDDLRFQMRMQDDANQISDRELLANALDTVAQNETERDYLKRYRKYIRELEQKQTQLDDLSARLKDLKADKASAKANRDLIMRMENNAKTLENSIQRTDKRLLDFEATKALKDVMAREKAAWKQTAKKRSDARVERLRESNRANTQARVDAARERVRASYERKLEAQQKKSASALEKAMDRKDKTIGKLEDKLERTEARFEERIAKMKESEKRTEYRKRILEDSATMREWLTTPTNKAHVPEFLRAPLGDFLKSIDYSSDSVLKGRAETKGDLKLIDAMDRMSRALAQARTQPDSLSTVEGFMGYLDLPSGFESEFNKLRDDIRSAMEAGAYETEDTPLNLMTSDQLKTLSNAIRTLNTSVRKMNRLIVNARYQTARDASASTIEELAKLGDRKKMGALRDTLSGWVDWKSATPFYAFQRFGEGGKAIFEGIQDGWDRMAFNVKQVLDFAESAYTPKQVRQWSRETHSVELSSKKTVQMTTAQLMSLYCLSRREQALKHLQGGGIRIASFKTKGGTVNQAENYTLSTADISKLTGMLTAEQIEVADKLQAFMSSTCADWGNEVSMQRFGYNAFTEENYFPIETDSNNRAAVDESARENDLFRLLNLSATKALVQNANNAVVLQDIFDVFAAHAADMAKYNGLALPILDTLKWYNYVEKTKPVNGQFTTQSVQKSLEAAYGRDAQKYVTNFIRDLNGKKEGGRNDGLINRMISNYKVAAVGANLRVGFLQITSMPRAAYVISPKYLAVGVAKNAFFHNSPIAEKKVGIALWKSLGFYDTNISRNIRDLIKNDAGFLEKARELSMTPAEKGDYWTMGVIYGAVEAEMADKHADVKKNTAKYDQMVNDRMREIIYKTQVVDSTMTRSDIMRGKGLASVASAFMSEPTLTMNLLSESVYEARMKARAGDSRSVAQALVGNRKFGKALAATTFVCAVSAVFEAVFSAYRDDDEYETFLEKFNDALVGDLSGADSGWEKFQAFWDGSIMDNFKLWNNIVFVKDISEALAGDSGDAAMWAAGFSDLATGVQQLYKSIFTDSGKPMYGSIYTTLKGVSEIGGFPMSAATRDTIGLYNTIAGAVGWKRIQTSNDKPSDAAEAIMRAEENGNTVLADRYRRIANEHGIGEEKLQNAMKSIIQSRFDAGKIEDKRAAELLEDYAGKDADDASVQVARWRYAKDTGLKYGDMKEDYLSGLLDETTALRYLTAEIGADKAAARVDRWNFEQLHGEDADYSSRWKLWEAFEGSGSYEGKTAEQYVREWAKTTDKKNIAAAIAGRYKDEYLKIKGTPAGNSMLEKLLNLYVAAGYEREYERDYINRKWVK